MAQFEFVITDANIGEVIGPPNGFLVKLMRTQPPKPSHQIPDYDPGRRRWKSAYLQLRASGESRDVVCVSSQFGGGWAAHFGNGMASLWEGASVAYWGDLTVLCVPKGSVWELTLSDIPVAKGTTPVSEVEAFMRGLFARAAKARAAAGEPQGASTARKADAILHAARAPA
jgi:hypothetical protein